MAHLHFGAAVPIVFRSFPSICGHSLGQPKTSLLLPDHLPGALKLILLAFNRRTHEELKSWCPTVEALQRQFAEKHPETPDALQTYRIVVRSRSARLFRWYLEERWRLLLFPDSLAASPAPSSSLSRAHSACSAPRSPPLASSSLQAATETAESGETADSTEADEREFRRLLSSTFFAYVDRRAFLASACLPDCQRPYLFLVDEKNKIQWCEHERFSEDKAFAATEIRRLLGLETAEPYGIEANTLNGESSIEERRVPLLTQREETKS
uniref:Uncharacterized protein n=1 Tax=Neospora caninum (strain Liverpool) TaxID=572307 RepID=A0A0F7UBQ3_NEOCL|nr:TPA: hypothetical protein BN1204_022225 [Neospora caninum Liverpool]